MIRGLTTRHMICQKMLGLCPIMNSMSLLNLEAEAGTVSTDLGETLAACLTLHSGPFTDGRVDTHSARHGCTAVGPGARPNPPCRMSPEHGQPCVPQLHTCTSTHLCLHTPVPVHLYLYTCACTPGLRSSSALIASQAALVPAPPSKVSAQMSGQWGLKAPLWKGLELQGDNSPPLQHRYPRPRAPAPLPTHPRSSAGLHPACCGHPDGGSCLAAWQRACSRRGLLAHTPQVWVVSQHCRQHSSAQLGVGESGSRGAWTAPGGPCGAPSQDSRLLLCCLPCAPRGRPRPGSPPPPPSYLSMPYT